MIAILKRFIAFVNKDVADENEAKGTAVIVRSFILGMLVYFAAQTFLFAVYREIQIVIYIFVLIFCYTVVFSFTYMGKTAITLWAVQILTVIWIIGSVWMMGWDCGVQHFLFVLLALSLVSGYHRVSVKVAMAVTYCIIRLMLYFYTLNTIAYYPLTRKEGIEFQVINTVAIFMQITLLIVTFSKEIQATERKLVKYNKKIKELASRDPLTKLRNRRDMMEKMNTMIEEARNQICFCIAIADIDFFKRVNDTYGHEAGDEVLKKISETLSAFMSDKGYVARWGGEEFLFVFKNGNGDEVMMQLDALRRQIGKLVILYNESEITVHMTFGVQEYDSDISLDTNISKADEKLYFGKTNGRNMVVF